MINYSAWIVSLVSLLGLLLFFLVLTSGTLYKGLFLEMLQVDLSGSIFMFSKLFLILLMVVATMIFLWANSYMLNSQCLSFFYFSFLGFVLSMSMLLLSNSFFFIFLGWEGLGVSSFLLIVFFQNWMSSNSGLLTLLTNRLGDAILLISFMYWISYSSGGMFGSWTMMIMLVVLAFTKSAQWPFISWLPAAMAAPTPVSALVHSSTLVTAGIWLMLRYSICFIKVSSIWVFFGSLTLLVASLSALLEFDAKKVVALSTLSQLGLMVLSLGLGSSVVCFFHVMMHALAKANLFLVVGNVLHFMYSQQDARFLGYFTISSMVGCFISIISLSGLCFVSGFYSKEQILFFYYSNFNSYLSLLLLISIISLTLAYSLKLMVFLSKSFILVSFTYSIVNIVPVIVLSIASLVMGWMGFQNVSTWSNLKAISLVYFFLVISVSLMLVSMVSGFELQTKLTKLIGFFFNEVKYMNYMGISVLESFSFMKSSVMSMSVLFYVSLILVTVLFLISF